MGEGAQIYVSDLVEELPECRAAVHCSAQDQGVDEHTHQVVEFALPTSGDGSSDGYVVLITEPRQQHCQGCVHNHEDRGVVCARQGNHTGMNLRTEVEPNPSASERTHVTARSISRNVENLRCARKILGPIDELFRDRGPRVGFGAQPTTLPQRVVGVLDRERRPPRCLTVHTGGVCAHEISGQRYRRESVGGDVVNHDHQDMRVGLIISPQQGGAHRDLLRDVETNRSDLPATLAQVFASLYKYRCEIRYHL
ncbi:hypothetical protein BKP42_68020 [Rhodococcus erythropolis]|nr:hypothetical protein BKP42_68020 [Rhodococcus erythropolis]